MSSISTTITGEAKFLEQGSEEEKWCKEAHLANNTFGDQVSHEAQHFRPRTGSFDDGNNASSSCYIEGEDVRVVIVQVKEGRTADWKGGVKDWVVEDGLTDPADTVEDRGRSNGQHLVNGIVT